MILFISSTSLKSVLVTYVHKYNLPISAWLSLHVATPVVTTHHVLQRNSWRWMMLCDPNLNESMKIRWDTSTSLNPSVEDPATSTVQCSIFIKAFDYDLFRQTSCFSYHVIATKVTTWDVMSCKWCHTFMWYCLPRCRQIWILLLLLLLLLLLWCDKQPTK